MAPAQQIDYILNDCFLAVGQAVGTQKVIAPEALGWWRDRYRVAFLNAMVRSGNSWERDRHRVTAVGRFLGERALLHAGHQATIDLGSARRASTDVESGCRMNAVREGVEGLRAKFPSDALQTTTIQTETRFIQ
jgi:hypothetical protein